MTEVDTMQYLILLQEEVFLRSTINAARILWTGMICALDQTSLWISAHRVACVLVVKSFVTSEAVAHA